MCSPSFFIRQVPAKRIFISQKFLSVLPEPSANYPQTFFPTRDSYSSPSSIPFFRRFQQTGKIQYYGQPFITRPRYNHFAFVAQPLANKFDDRFYVFKASQISFSNDQYLIDENSDGTIDYSFSKPDFNFVQFRSNLIIRWEYRAGSELYLVWSQSNTADAFDDLDSPLAKSLFENAFAEQSRNIFLIKWTYRFLR